VWLAVTGRADTKGGAINSPFYSQRKRKLGNDSALRMIGSALNSICNKNSCLLTKAAAAARQSRLGAAAGKPPGSRRVMLARGLEFY